MIPQFSLTREFFYWECEQRDYLYDLKQKFGARGYYVYAEMPGTLLCLVQIPDGSWSEGGCRQVTYGRSLGTVSFRKDDQVTADSGPEAFILLFEQKQKAFVEASKYFSNQQGSDRDFWKKQLLQHQDTLQKALSAKERLKESCTLKDYGHLSEEAFQAEVEKLAIGLAVLRFPWLRKPDG